MSTERLLRKASQVLGAAAGTGALAAALAITPASAQAQYAVSDSQLQSSVQSALAKDTKLGSTKVQVTANQGVVTLAGSVPSEDIRVEAEQVAAGVSGIRSIQDNLTTPGEATPAAAGTPTAANSNAASQAANQAAQTGQANQPESAQAAPSSAMPPAPPASPGTAASGMPPAPPSDDETTQQQQASQQYTPYPNGTAQSPRQNQPQMAQGQYPQPYPQQPYPPQNNGYGPRGNAYPPQTAAFGVSPQQQNSSGPVVIAPGTLLNVRTSEPLSTNVLKGGEYFQVTAAADTYVNGVVAIPRGAVLTGQVIESKNAGPFGGSPKLDLKLTSLQLGPTTYPLQSEVWSSQGPSKTGYTARNTAGGALFGALIGGIAGGGVGAGVGAIAGGAGGALVSGATHGPRLDLPPEAMLQFHLTGPLTVQPVHYDEAERLAASVPQQPVLHQRPVYVAAPYPYAPRPYPYPYPY